MRIWIGSVRDFTWSVVTAALPNLADELARSIPFRFPSGHLVTVPVEVRARS
ncbi:MAG: hypothetical protein JWR35_790 [Marmoricola sp.]|jgi:hypothetical protein|nr:hypothetical protein [Marmoricola sp.]